MAKINYSNKVTLNEQPSISEENKVTASDMNEIKQVVNTNDDTVQGIINGESYSTTEVKTNKVWIDGKPIYRKVISTGAISTTGNDNYVSLGINSASISQITEIGGTINISVGTIPVNFYNKYDQQYSVFVFVDLEQTTARVDVKNAVAITGGYVVVEYTKVS